MNPQKKKAHTSASHRPERIRAGRRLLVLLAIADFGFCAPTLAADFIIVTDLKYPVSGFARADVSGVGIVGDSIFLAIDRRPNNGETSSILAAKLDGFMSQPPAPAVAHFEKRAVFADLDKIEDLAVAMSGAEVRVLGLTAFDRFEISGQYDSFNRLAWWSPSDEAAGGLVETVTASGGVANLRVELSRAIGIALHHTAPLYFKVEGLAIGPYGGRLLVGVREAEESGKQRANACLVLGAPFSMDPAPRISGPFSEILQFSPAILLPKESLSGEDASFWAMEAASFGISGLCYDKAKNRLIILTSFERESVLRSAIWVSDFADGRFSAPSLSFVFNDNGKSTTLFRNKAEGVTVTATGELVVVCDDDNVQDTGAGWTRKLTEARIFVLRDR